MKIKRRKTRTVTVGNVRIGSEYPVSIQSMTNTDTKDISSTAGQIKVLEDAGCELVRLAIKDEEAAKAIGQIKKETTIPLIADIHFDYKLALSSIKYGADKIRINPGNISKTNELDEIISLASEKGIPLRIGVNSGSLPQGVSAGSDLASSMVDSLLRYLEYFQKKNFNDIVLSLKASGVPATVKAYREISEKCDYPLHLGVTAAGSPHSGIVKSSIGIGALLLDGIGDTIRVSLTGDPEREVETAKRILASTLMRSFGPEVIACPTCGRCQIDLISLVEDLEKKINSRKFSSEKALVIAIMGCEVNGPGEAKEADIGIAFGKDRGAIFKKGKIVKTVQAKDAIKELLDLIDKEMCSD